MSEFTVEIAKQLLEHTGYFPVGLRDACEWLKITDYFLAVNHIEYSFERSKHYIVVGRYTNNIPSYEHQLSTHCFRKWCSLLCNHGGIEILNTIQKAEQELREVKSDSLENLKPAPEQDLTKQVKILTLRICELESRLSQLEKFCD